MYFIKSKKILLKFCISIRHPRKYINGHWHTKMGSCTYATVETANVMDSFIILK